MCSQKKGDEVRIQAGVPRGAHFYTDGSGGSRNFLPSYAQRVGAAAVQLELDEAGRLTNLAWSISSVNDRQTVPRAECVGASAALDLAKVGEVKEPILHIDAAYVVNGSKVINARCNTTNADVWTELKDKADDAGASYTKVAAHTQISQVAAGEVRWEDYVGNAVADVFAKVAAERAQLPPLIKAETEKNESLAFMVCMRIATIEEIIDQQKTEIAAWEVKLAEPQMTEDQVAEEILNRAADFQHALVRLPSGRCRCTKCGVTFPPKLSEGWLTKACGNNDAHARAGKHERLIEVKHCTFNDYLHAQRKQNLASKTASYRNLQRIRRGLANFLSSAIAEPCGTDDAGPLPDWAEHIDQSHARLIFGGGYVCCVECGALAGSHHHRSGLFTACPVSRAQEWRLPEGSKGRLQRIKQGKHPEGKQAEAWPDGRRGSLRIKMRVHRRSLTAEVLQPAAAEPDDWFDSEEELQRDAADARARVSVLTALCRANFATAVPGLTICTRFLDSWLAADARKALDIVLNDLQRWPLEWQELHKLYADAQLIAWPEDCTEATAAGFGKQFQLIVESTDAFQLELAQGLQYPEEIPFLSEAAPSHSMKLAAGFFLAAESELLESNEASVRLTDKLVQLSKE